jgi:hypothetical protein
MAFSPTLAGGEERSWESYRSCKSGGGGFSGADVASLRSAFVGKFVGDKLS